MVFCKFIINVKIINHPSTLTIELVTALLDLIGNNMKFVRIIIYEHFLKC